MPPSDAAPTPPDRDIARTLEDMDERLQRIETTLARVEASARRMDAHIVMVERMLTPFRTLALLGGGR